MARINIEDSIYTDHRFLKFIRMCTSVDEALGALVRAWMLAQKWYLKEDQMIPLSEWQKQEIHHGLIDIGLAEVISGPLGDRVKIRGADEQFAWLRQRADAGYKGGVATATSRYTTAKRGVATVKPPYSLLSSPSSVLNAQAHKNTNAQAGAWASEIHALYPRKVGKKRGIEKLIRILKTDQDFRSVLSGVQNYVAYLQENETDSRHMKHFDTFMNSWEDWLEPDAGSGLDFSGPKTQKTHLHRLNPEDLK